MLPALIAGGASLLGGFISNRGSASRQEDMQAFNAQEAQVNRDFQERMSNSAHQREVQDLRAAGLNPILSGTGGMGSATPSGSAASSSAIPATDYITPAVSSAVDTYRSSADVDEKRQNINIKKPVENLALAAAGPVAAGADVVTKGIPEIVGEAIHSAISAFNDPGQPERKSLPERVWNSYKKIWEDILPGTKNNTYYNKSNPEPKRREGWNARDALNSIQRRGVTQNSAKDAEKHPGLGTPRGRPIQSFPGKWE